MSASRNVTGHGAYVRPEERFTERPHNPSGAGRVPLVELSNSTGSREPASLVGRATVVTGDNNVVPGQRQQGPTVTEGGNVVPGGGHFPQSGQQPNAVTREGNVVPGQRQRQAPVGTRDNNAVLPPQPVVHTDEYVPLQGLLYTPPTPTEPSHVVPGNRKRN